ADFRRDALAGLIFLVRALVFSDCGHRAKVALQSTISGRVSIGIGLARLGEQFGFGLIAGLPDAAPFVESTPTQVSEILSLRPMAFAKVGDRVCQIGFLAHDFPLLNQPPELMPDWFWQKIACRKERTSSAKETGETPRLKDDARSRVFRFPVMLVAEVGRG